MDVSMKEENMKLCKVAGCSRVRRTRGYCAKHYQWWRVHGDPDEKRPPRRTVAKKEENYPCKVTAIESQKVLEYWLVAAWAVHLL